MIVWLQVATTNEWIARHRVGAPRGMQRETEKENISGGARRRLPRWHQVRTDVTLGALLLFDKPAEAPFFLRRGHCAMDRANTPRPTGDHGANPLRRRE